MKLELALLSLLALSGVVLFNQEQTPVISSQTSDIHIMKAFQQWKSEFGQNFNNGEEEYRFLEFKENYLFIESHNAKNTKLTLGLNQFAAMSNSEFKSTMLMKDKKVAVPENLPEATVDTALPSSVDWVKGGAVFATQDQGHCGSCWAFATIGGLQGLRAIKDGKLELLSAQQITSCVPSYYNDDKTSGCGGGETRYSYQYVSHMGIQSGVQYPYTDGTTGVTSPCKYDKSKVVFSNTGYYAVPQFDTTAMKQAVVGQPVSIAVDASSVFFQFYKTGIIDSENCGLSLNHAIMMVGYNLEGKEPYWMIQNSWGTTWGENGFGKVAISEGPGVCGINSQVDYPTLVPWDQLSPKQ